MSIQTVGGLFYLGVVFGKPKRRDNSGLEVNRIDLGKSVSLHEKVNSAKMLWNLSHL